MGGVAAILERKPDDVVITFAKRTALGRAKKGQLKDVPVDELMQALIKAGACTPNLIGMITYRMFSPGDFGKDEVGSCQA